MIERKWRKFVCDFETTVYDGQVDTEVWASACVELFTEDVHIFHSIEDTLKFFIKQETNIVAYYHNLKFDGSFWLSYLLTEAGYTQAFTSKVDTSEQLSDVHWLPDHKMPHKSVKYSISDKGQWYTITISYHKHIIQIRDSLKLLPFSVRKIGKDFKTKHQKLDMDYTGYRYAGCEITDKEKEYIANDVLVVKEALEIMFNQGHDKLTIGSCCLSEYKQICKTSTINTLSYEEMFPDIYKKPLDEETYGYPNMGEWVRRSYKGGWCYLVKGKDNKVFSRGVTADVNSLYPSMMSSESGNRYPVGLPHFWKGNIIPDEALMNTRYYFVRVKTRFYLKENKLPFIQIKNSFMYRGTECLESSDLVDRDTGEAYSTYLDKDGNTHDTRVTLTLTMTDYELFKEHYELVDFEILDGCWFYSKIGIFDEYIDKYKKIKQESKGAIRQIAKLFLNNLYGKMASSEDSSFKVAYEKPDQVLGFQPVTEHEKTAGYIPVGSAITSYARNFTIRAAQKNFYGKDERGFIYADTDSIHCDLEPEEVKGITIHPTDFCCWKLESSWDKAIFVRQKTYIEHVVAEDLEPISTSYNNIKCAGMPDKCKNLFNLSMEGTADPSGYINEATGEHKEWSKEEYDFLFDSDTGCPRVRTYSDFRRGLTVPGKLVPKRMKGGILLVETTYQMRY